MTRSTTKSDFLCDAQCQESGNSYRVWRGNPYPSQIVLILVGKSTTKPGNVDILMDNPHVGPAFDEADSAVALKASLGPWVWGDLVGL